MREIGARGSDAITFRIKWHRVFSAIWRGPPVPWTESQDPFGEHGPQR
jgi:hypothetical protein